MKRGRTPQSTVPRRRRSAAGALAGDDDAGHRDPRRPLRGVELAAIKRRISTELEDIAAQLRRQDGPVVAEHTRGDFFDAAQVVEHREREHLNTGRLAHRARRLAAALERVRAGAYGICAECGEPIPGARLIAIPDADACVRCQAQLEEARQAREAEGAGVQSAWKLGRRRTREASPR
jgi:DnaK suppressor protein